jgi:hypothetical protein
MFFRNIINEMWSKAVFLLYRKYSMRVQRVDQWMMLVRQLQQCNVQNAELLLAVHGRVRFYCKYI